jgi:hypothetical protein
MKTFNETINGKLAFEGMDISYLSSDEINEAVNLYNQMDIIVNKDGIKGLEQSIEEGLLGGLAGFIVGPTIGRVIANALGIERGILYDMLTSRLVSAALGSAIQKNL